MATMLYDAALLEQLRQMSGVVGSMLISSDGELISHSMPAQRSDALLAAAPRLSVLLEALSAGRPAESYSLRFASHRLLIQPVEGAFLCVLCDLSGTSPLLRMAMKVTGRRLQ